MIKRKEKGIALGMLLALSAALIYCGFIGWKVYLIPLQYLGLVLGAIGVAGLLGLDIWVGPFAIDTEDDKKDGPDDTIRSE
jgi:hypothetical protein